MAAQVPFQPGEQWGPTVSRWAPSSRPCSQGGTGIPQGTGITFTSCHLLLWGNDLQLPSLLSPRRHALERKPAQ